MVHKNQTGLSLRILLSGRFIAVNLRKFAVSFRVSLDFFVHHLTHVLGVSLL
jgi:hypothetical protein